MRKIFYAILLIAFSLATGCVHEQRINPPKSGRNRFKIDRFYYMQNRWSYLNNNWIVSENTSPELLGLRFGIPKKLAKKDVSEFISTQRAYSGWDRFLASINLRNINFYIKN
ncbi:MAG TPA: hypothetical protein QF753_21975 [Victivallales bacterium]|nr:hypothetical protein [Victivallales bacterium]